MARSKPADAKVGIGVVRRLWPTERDLFREHLLRLDPETRHQRFGTAVNDAFLENYAATTFGVGGLVFRVLQLCFTRGVQTGLVWGTKIITDPFNDWKLYRKSFGRLLRGEKYDHGMVPAE